jgi:ElaB/YqjD/DUF883 family membrane-anchored ribosome-binding protein
MQSVVNESEVEGGAEVQAGCVASCCGHDAQEMAKRIEQGVSDAKHAVGAKLENGKAVVERLLKRGRNDVEECVGETARKIKHHPFRFLAIAFAAGAALGFLTPRSTKK